MGDECFMKCPNCGAEGGDGRFCPYCGSELPIRNNQAAVPNQYNNSNNNYHVVNNYYVNPGFPNQMPMNPIPGNQVAQNNYQQNLSGQYFIPQQNTRTVCPVSSSKSKNTALLLCFFMGVFGIHQFYVGKTGKGILYLLTGGLFGIGWLIDLFTIAENKFKDSNDLPLTGDSQLAVRIISIIMILSGVAEITNANSSSNLIMGILLVVVFGILLFRSFRKKMSLSFHS